MTNLLQLLLSLPELGQVQRCNFLRVLNLFLVSSGLVLQFLHQVAHPLEVLLLLLLGELELLDLPVGPQSSLVSLRRSESLLILCLFAGVLSHLI